LTRAFPQLNLPPMPALSTVLGVLSLVCIALGVLTTPIPVLGALFSFCAPALAIAGIIVGGLAMSRAKQAARRRAPAQSDAGEAAAPGLPEESRNSGRTGVIISAVALLPALLTAMTCGVCNALCSTGQIRTQRDFQFNVQRGPIDARPDAGPRPDAGRPDAPVPSDAARPSDEAPPPVFPPPPLDAPP
jgi:hypothetical protein